MCEEEREFRDKLIKVENLQDEELEEYFNSLPLPDDTQCGMGSFRAKSLKIFASKKSFIVLYGIVGCFLQAPFAYFNATITTIEKRYKIPSKNTAFIAVGNDICCMILSAFLSYYGGKGHRPRWLAFGMYTTVLFCFLSALPHFIYGPGEQALSLTKEFQTSNDGNNTLEVLEIEKRKFLCQNNSTLGITCEVEEGNWMPQVILFIGQLVGGIGQSLFFTLGVAYMDDNIVKSKVPALVSVAYFIRLLGPTLGYSLASYSLKIYILPSLTPTITDTDPRWLGAWWLGWTVIATGSFILAFFLLIFPKELPRAYVRRMVAAERERRALLAKGITEIKVVAEASFSDMMATFKRLSKNLVYILNNVASIFYFFGFMPYWMFTPKYIETQYKQSASTASLVTGTIALTFSALGVLLAGAVISKYKPCARTLALWNVFCGATSVVGMISYAYMGCSVADHAVIINQPLITNLTPTCNSNCHCDYVKYAPVCGNDNNTYISACHAGCQDSFMTNDKKTFEQCSCVDESALVRNNNHISEISFDNVDNADLFFSVGSATSGPCKIDCQREFYSFLAIMCFMQFIAAAGRASNFLVTVRCVDEEDKSTSMGVGEMMLSLFSFVPSPLFFGRLLDSTCILWGKTCSGTGNCWLYDGERLRYLLNFIAAGFVLVGTLCDIGVWHNVKHIKIFDDEPEDLELKKTKNRLEIH